MKNKINLLVIIFATFVALSVSIFSDMEAAPLVNYPIKLVQPDGLVINCFVTGDEFYCRVHDADNFTIIQDQNTGYYVYASIQNDILIPTDYIVGRTDPNNSGLTKGINLSPAKIYSLVNSSSMRFNKSSGIETVLSVTTGTINNIVVYIRFQNENEFTDNGSYYNGLFNNNSAGANSLFNYFNEVSYSALSVSSTFYPYTTGTTVISYQDLHPRNYYEPYSSTNPDGYC